VRCFLVAAALVIALSSRAGSADAAMAVRIVVTPSQPAVNARATVSVLTLAPFSERCVDDPTADYRPWSDWNTGGMPLRLVLQASQPGTEPIDLSLDRRDGDPTWWDGKITFPAPGEWTLRMSHPTWAQAGADAEACAGARITVRVSDRLPATSTSARAPEVWLLGALVTSAVLGLVVSWVRRPRRRIL
jgi:hypothetical protein